MMIRPPASATANVELEGAEHACPLVCISRWSHEAFLCMIEYSCHQMDRQYVDIRPAPSAPDLGGGPSRTLVKRRRLGVSVACDRCRLKKIRVSVTIFYVSTQYHLRTIVCCISDLAADQSTTVQWQAPCLLELHRPHRRVCVQGRVGPSTWVGAACARNDKDPS